MEGTPCPHSARRRCLCPSGTSWGRTPTPCDFHPQPPSPEQPLPSMHNQTHPPIPLDLLAVQRDKKNQRRSPEPWPRGALCSHTGDRSRAPPCWGSRDAPVLARRAPRPSLSPLPAFGCRSAPWLGPSLHGSGPAPPETPAPGVPSLARVSAHRRCFRCTPLHWCRCWYPRGVEAGVRTVGLLSMPGEPQCRRQHVGVGRGAWHVPSGCSLGPHPAPLKASSGHSPPWRWAAGCSPAVGAE